MEPIGLAEAVQVLRDELALARDAATGEPVAFTVGPVEVEFALVAKRTGGGRFGFTIGVVTAGADGSIAREQTHRVKFVLTPKVVATGQSPEIAGRVDAIPGE